MTIKPLILEPLKRVQGVVPSSRYNQHTSALPREKL